MKRTTTTARRPSLWRRLGRSNRLLPRKLKLTREGKWVLLITLGVGFGAVNTGNNLLYLIFGLLLSLITVSGILSELTLRGLEAEVDSPDEIFAKRSTFVRTRLRNTKRRLASFSVEVELAWEDERAASQRPAYFLVLAPGAQAEANLELRMAHRGAHTTWGVRIATRFPFGFFRKSRIFPEARTLTAFPALVPVEPPPMPPGEAGVESHAPRAGRGDEYYGLRDMRSGDDLRDIYWKVSARRGQLVVREYEEPVRRHVTLCVPNLATAERYEAMEEVERVLEEAASLAVLLAGSGSNVGLATMDEILEPASGPRHLSSLLHRLAGLPIYVRAPGTPVVMDGAARGDCLLVRHRKQRGLLAEGRFATVREVGGEA